MHGSFSSVIRLVDVFGEFLVVVRSFAVYRVVASAVSYVWRVLCYMVGREAVAIRAANGDLQVRARLLLALCSGFLPVCMC